MDFNKPDRLALLLYQMDGRETLNEALFRLAEETDMVLLPGRGFGTPHQSARVSLANLNEYNYSNIGCSVHKLALEFHAEFLADKNPARITKMKTIKANLKAAEKSNT